MDFPTSFLWVLSTLFRVKLHCHVYLYILKTYDLSVRMIIIAKMMSDCDYTLFETINKQ